MKFVLFVLAVIGSSLAGPFAQNKESTITSPEGLIFKDFLPGNESDTNSERIAGGMEGPIDVFPWHLSIRNTHDRIHFCGGSIITATRGLTAGSCVHRRRAEYLSVLVGTSERSLAKNGVHTRLQRFVRHPRYDHSSRRNDIAVLWFASPLAMGPTMRPIALPAQNVAIPYGLQTVVSGWGRRKETAPTLSPTLKFINLVALNNDQCNKAYLGRVLPEMVCAGSLEGGPSICSGDEGGALVANGVQIGIASWARGCGRVNSPSVFTRLPLYVDWIRSAV